MSDFWNSLTQSFAPRENRTLQDFLKGAEAPVIPVAKSVDTLPAGARVAFQASLEAMLSYTRPPKDGLTGTVVMVRTASGDCTTANGQVFVRWDSGEFFPVYANHLQLSKSLSKRSSDVFMSSQGVGDLGSFLRVSGSDSDLIHKATRDLWSLKTSETGDMYLARLFDETGNPLKV